MISSNRLRQRSAIIREIRVFFEERDYLEIDTPLRLPSLAPELWVEPEVSGTHFLQTSPELCMKRLLAAGNPRLFQICHCFRRGERGKRHLPEFAMLEWYRINSDYHDLMDECEELISSVILECGSSTLFPGLAEQFTFDAPFTRLTVGKAFSQYADCSVAEALAADRYEEVMVEQVEPNLGINRPTFLYDYPASLASLARLKRDGSPVAERFEFYINGVELANGFSELVDPVEQRQRFEKDRAAIYSDGRDPGPMPEIFLASLANIGEAAGIALGLDRLVMVLTGAASIDEVVGFIPEEL